MTTKTKTRDLLEEEHRMEQEIERLEAERSDLESPSRIPTWEEIEAGVAEDLEKRERRRGIIPRLITAAKVRRLELIRERYEAEMEPLLKRREKAYTEREAATAKRIRAMEEEGVARYEYSDANMRIESRAGRIKRVEREIRELRGEG